MGDVVGDVAEVEAGRKYWYDFELKDEHRLLYDIDDHNRKEGAKSSGAQLLDAFLYHNYSIGDLPGSVRVGKQVVSWGESTFIQNSINSINPMDVAAFRRPGAEIKEGLIPVNMLYLSPHLYNPRNVVPESKMPAYPWLVENKLDGKDTATKMEVLRKLGVPYTDEDIAGAREAVKGKTEMDALVAFLQGLGTSIKSKR